MRLYLILLINPLMAVNVPVVNYKRDSFLTYLDHFDIWNDDELALSYYQYDDFFEKGGPLLLEISTEEDKDPIQIVNRTSYMLAQELHGTLVYIDHRFYGRSAPLRFYNNPKLPFKFRNQSMYYQYNNVEQALEDFVHFIQVFKEENNRVESKVGVFGCSYAGSIATWLRYKFPHLIDAAWASNAPLHATLLYPTYYETVAEIYKTHSEKCYQRLYEACQVYAKGNREYTAYIHDKWSCPAEVGREVTLEYIRQPISDPYFLQQYYIKNTCDEIGNKNWTSEDVFMSMLKYFVNRSSSFCNYNNATNSEYARKYQKCTEFGYSLTTDSENQPFVNSSQYSAIIPDLRSCNDEFLFPFYLNEFDVEYNIRRKNRLYGSEYLPVSQVFFIYGTNDPWQKLGYGRKENEDAPKKMVKGMSYCANFYSRLNLTSPTTDLEKQTANGINKLKHWLRH